MQLLLKSNMGNRQENATKGNHFVELNQLESMDKRNIFFSTSASVASDMWLLLIGIQPLARQICPS